MNWNVKRIFVILFFILGSSLFAFGIPFLYRLELQVVQYPGFEVRQYITPHNLACTGVVLVSLGLAILIIPLLVPKRYYNENS